MRRRLPFLVLAAVTVLGACASPAGNGGAAGAGGSRGTQPGATDGVVQADDDLRISVDEGDGAAPHTWTLTCGGSVEGTHPRAEEACAHLDGMTDPFAPLPRDLVCTEQYGGPQTAHISGRWRGEAVDLELSRVNGCRISQWDSFGPVLPVPVGIEPLG